MKININIDGILQSRGLGKSKETQKFIANEVARLSDPYVPMQSGDLKNHRIIANDGSTITYPGPYAHYHWVGEIYGPNIPIGEEGFISRAPKKPTGREMKYNDAPMRGPKWTKRMMADRSDDLVRSVADRVGGKLK